MTASMDSKESKVLFEDETPDYASLWKDTRSNLMEAYSENTDLRMETTELRKELEHKNSLLKQALKARVSKQDRGSWMNLSFGVKVKQFAEAAFKSII